MTSVWLKTATFDEFWPGDDFLATVPVPRRGPGAGPGAPKASQLADRLASRLAGQTANLLMVFEPGIRELEHQNLNQKGYKI